MKNIPPAAALVFLAAGGFLIWQQSYAPTQTFQSAEEGFSASIPAGWTTDTSGGEAALASPDFQFPVRGERFEIQTENVSPALQDPAAFEKFYTDQVNSAVGTTRAGTVTIGGEAGYVSATKVESGMGDTSNSAMNARSIQMVHGGKLYTVTYEYAGNFSAGVQAIFDVFVKSFSFTL